MGMDVSSGPIFLSKKNRGGLTVDASSGVIFLKKKKKKESVSYCKFFMQLITSFLNYFLSCVQIVLKTYQDMIRFFIPFAQTLNFYGEWKE